MLHMHVVDKFAIGQAYHPKIKLSQTCCFITTKPDSTIGMASNQFDTSFSRFTPVSPVSILLISLKYSYIAPLFLFLFYFLVLKRQMN